MTSRDVVLNEKGFSLLTSVLAMVGLAVTGAVFASGVTQHQYAAVNQLLSTQALHLAESGFELAIQEFLDNQDYAFNGAPAGDGVGNVTNVPLGPGTVTVTCDGVTKLCTSTGTVGDISRVTEMTLDVKNLVKNDPVFEDVANLDTNWPETVSQSLGASGIESGALKSWTTPGKNQDFTAYREQVLDQTVPAGSRISVRLSYMRSRTGAGSTANRHTLELQVVKSDGTTDTVWSKGPFAVSDTDNGVWLVEEIRGWATSSSLATQKVRLVYDLGTTGSASATDQAVGRLDNIAVNIVSKVGWREP